MKLKILGLVIFTWMTLALHLGIAEEIQNSVSEKSDSKKAVGDGQIVWTDLGRSANVLCETVDSAPIQACFWSYKSSATNETFTFGNVTQNSGSAHNNTNYVINDQNLSAGSCGISIRKITKKDFGDWKCVLVTSESDTQVFLGVLQVLQWDLPKFKPNIEHIERYEGLQDLGTPREINKTFDAVCCTKSGRPDPTLSFMIGNLTINETKYEQDYGEKNNICIIWKTPIFTRKMNGQKLRCIMDHVSISDSQKMAETHQDSVLLNITFPPTVEGIRENRTIQVTVPKDFETFNVSVTASGNPYPKVMWQLPAAGNDPSIHHPRDLRQNNNFDITDRNISCDTVQSTLIIKKPDDLRSNNGSVTVHVSNIYGVAAIRYEFNFQSNIEISNTITIIVISVVVFLTVIIIAGLIGVFVRKRRASSKLYVVARRTANVVSTKSMGEIANAEEVVYSTKAPNSEDTATPAATVV